MSRRHGLHPGGPRRGFTLVEMLVATALCSVLLAALWGLYSTYADLFERGQMRVERSQLCRALMQQLADDLRCAIQDPLPGRDAAELRGAPLRRFSFSGSANELRVDILQVGWRPRGASAATDATGPTAEPAGPRVPELRTVHYAFAGPSGTESPPPGHAGLVRREFDFETPLPVAVAGDPEASLPRAGNPAEDPAEDPHTTWVPEVVAVGFRYFDGKGWTSGWNSIQRKSLPVAVEVTLRLTDPDTSRHVPASPSVAEPSAEDLFESPKTTVEPAARPATEYRMIVDLPGSPTYRQERPKPAAAAAPPTSLPPPATVVVPRIAPPRWTAPSGPPRLPEEWIRTRSP
jgi:prepilin-type N-terminal cleavage/methylation domain-containing protein